MIAIARFRVPESDADAMEHRLVKALAIFSEREGFSSGEYGQNFDDRSLWALVTHWVNVGAYRRALSSLPVKMEVVPLLSTAIDEPGAYSDDL
jgi:heme-degrading monooxygenase HmoA